MKRRITGDELRLAASSVRAALLESVDEFQSEAIELPADSDILIKNLLSEGRNRRKHTLALSVINKVAVAALIPFVSFGALVAFNEDVRAMTAYRLFGYRADSMDEYLEITITKSFKIKSDFDAADMQLESVVAISPSSRKILEVKNAKVYQQGSFTNFKSWETEDISWEINTPEQGYVRYSISGTAAFSQKVPSSGTKVGKSSPINENIEIDCFGVF